MATAALADEDTDTQTSPYLPSLPMPGGGPVSLDSPYLLRLAPDAPPADEDDKDGVSFPVPGSDAEALAFLQRLKAVTDAHAAMPDNQHPDNQADFAANRQQIIDAGIETIHDYHDAAKTPFSAKALQIIHGSPDVDAASLPDVDHAEIAQLASQFVPGSITAPPVAPAAAAPQPSPALAPLYPLADDSIPFPGAVDSLLRVPGAGAAAYALDADTLEPVSGALLPDGTVNRAGIIQTGGSGGRFPVPGPADYSLPGGSLSTYGLPSPGAATPAAGSGYRPSQYMERGYFSSERDPQSGRFEFIHDDNAPTARLVPQEALTPPAKDLTAYQRQNLSIRQQREERLSGPPAPKPVMDNWTRLSADLKALTDHGLADFQGVPPEDRHLLPDGSVQYLMPGDGGVSKEPVVLSREMNALKDARYNAIRDGNPRQINASTSGAGAPAQPTARPAASPAPAAAQTGNASGADDQAAAWAAANPNDPRAVRIRQMLNLP